MYTFPGRSIFTMDFLKEGLVDFIAARIPYGSVAKVNPHGRIPAEQVFFHVFKRFLFICITVSFLLNELLFDGHFFFIMYYY